MICQDRSCTLHVLDGGSATDWSKSIPHRKIISMWHKPRSFQQLYVLCNSYSCWMTFSLVGWLISVLVSEICRVKSQLTAATTYSTRVTTTPCKELLDGIVTLPGKCLCGLGICGPSILNEAPHNGRPNRISIRHHIWPFIHTSSHIYSVPLCFRCLSQAYNMTDVCFRFWAMFTGIRLWCLLVMISQEGEIILFKYSI